MSEVRDVIAELSPQARKLLELRLSKRTKTRPAPAGIPRREDRQSLPLSYAQERLWFLEQWDPGTALYHIPLLLSVEGDLKADLLDQGLELLLRRHEVLRSSYVDLEGEPIQVLRPPGDRLVREVDLTALPAGRRALALELAAVESRRPFDLSLGPLVRALLVRLDRAEHLLLVTMHHIVSDGWSIGVLLREIGALYEALAAGDDPRRALPELPIQYADFASWQRGWLRGPELERQVAYWRERLAQSPGVLDLPGDRPRGAVQTSSGATLSVTWPAPFAEALEKLARSSGATLFMVLLTGLDALLARYTGQRDLVVGTPVANRHRIEVEGLIGFFVNTLALRTVLGGDPTFPRLLERVRDGVLGDFAHQDLPFEKLIEELQPERHLSHAPLFQVMLVLQNAPLPDLGLSNLTLRPLPVETGTAKFDLLLEMVARDGVLSVAAEYNSDLFDAGSVRRLLDHFEVLLAGAVAAPASRLSALPLLTPAEREQLVVRWNDSGRDPGPPLCLHDLFEQRVAAAHDAEALSWAGGDLSYGELDHRANVLARRLARLGVGPEVRVAVCVERSPEMVAALLAVLKAGGVYVPLDPAYPAERLAFMLEDADAAALLTTGELLGRLPEKRPPLVLLGEEEAAEPPRARRHPAPENLAYLIYTSGSTGRPKAVALTHRSAVARIRWAGDHFDPEELAGVLASTSICFDLSVFEIFVPLSHGGRVVLVRDALDLADPGAARDVRLVNTVPSAMSALLALGELPRTVRTVNVAGEPLRGALVEEIYRRSGVSRVWNLYGPSEDTTYSTGALVPAGDPRPPAIGRPLRGTRAYLADRHLRLTPTGIPGELLLSGVGLARGYLGRPALTAERFVPDPWGREVGGRLYHTGDLVRHRGDGELQFIGRLDHQVKVRGFRVELGEIEALLETCPDLAETVVLAWEGRSGDLSIVAYVVPAVETSAVELVERLNERVRSALPEHMVPASFKVLEALPRTPNGKVDRGALHPPDDTADATARTFVAPRNEVEQLLAGIFAEVLGSERFGVHDDFFHHGGHSLLATRVVARVRRTCGVELPLRRLFELPTVAALAASVDELRKSSPATAPPIRPAGREGVLPLSFAQERLWFFDQLEPGNAAYNVPLALRLEGELEPGWLAQALSAVEMRHEVLRTRFVAGDDGPVVEALPPRPRALPQVALDHLEAGSREGELRRRLTAEATQPFDLASGPLVRSLLLRLAPKEWVLAVTFHHAVTDGWSTGIFLRDLSELYVALSCGRSPALPELPVQYADFACWQREWLRGAALERRIDFWRRQLAGADSVLELPTDRLRPAVQSYRGGRITRALESALWQMAGAASRRLGVTPFMLLLAAFEVLLYRASRQSSFTVGTPAAGRTLREVEDLVGFFVNTIVLRAELSAGMSFGRLLDEVRRTALDAYSHQELPFEKLVEELEPDRRLSHSPLFQVMIAFQNVPRPRIELQDLRLEVLETETAVAKFDLTLTLAEDGGGLEAVAEYNRDLFDATTIERLLGRLEVLLRAALDDPQEPIAALPLLAPPERHQLLVEWGDTAADYPLDKLQLHGLVEAQVARTPEAVALVFEGGALSYRELDARAERLAEHLGDLGVGPESRVALYLDRSPEMVIALLGTLKAGGAYLPLDPDYPPERLAFMIEDSQAPVILTRPHLAGRLPQHAARVVDLEADRPRAPECGRRARARVHPLHPAYVLYTSGSTGRPKGAVISHRAICNHMLWMQRVYPLSTGDGVLQKTPFSFDASVWEFWAPLQVGARLILARPRGHRDPAYLAGEIARQQATILQVVPTLLNLLLERPELARCTTLERVYCGGEPLTAELSERFHDRLAADLINVYGPTEASIHAASWCCHRHSTPPSVPIGRPIDNGGVLLLDGGLRPVPIGVPGELHVAGAGLGRGYLGRPSLTAEKFRPDPVAGEPGERLYATGDLARALPAGEIDFLGRLDHQVKIRGFRVELGEIEALLKELPAVHEGVVTVRVEDGMQNLVAYVVPESAGATAFETVQARAALSEKLPDYMVPAVFVVLRELPLLPNGKVDRRSLPDPGPLSRASDRVYAAPRTPVEEILAGFWEELLGLTGVGVSDGFFELGGHSLLATRLLALVRHSFGVELPLRALFEEPTIAALARRIENARGSGQRRAAPPVEPVGLEGPAQLSFAQERLWFLDQLEPGRAAYNIPAAVRLRGRLRAAALDAAFDEIVRRHEILRARFPSIDGRPRVETVPFEPRGLATIDLRSLAERRERIARELIDAQASGPFDLRGGPAWRIFLVQLADDEHVLALTQHHIVTDGWSIGNLVRELAELYRAAIDGAPPPFGEPELQYADFAHWQRRWLGGDALEEQLAYWRGQLGGASKSLDLPTDRPRPATPTRRGGSWLEDLPRPLSDAVALLGRSRGVTPFMVLLGAFQALLARYSGQSDVAVGTPIAGRGRLELEGLLGCFVNTLVLRSDLAGDPTVGELLERVRAVALGAYSHQDVPFERLVEELDPRRDPSRSPLFQVFFSLQNAPVPELELPDLTLGPIAAESGQARFDLTLEISEGPEGYLCRFEYGRDLFDATTVGRLAAHYRRLLGSLTAGLDEPVAALPWLSSGECQELLYEWNDTARDVHRGVTVDRLFAAQAAAGEERVALRFAGEVLSYGELDRRAELLARHLRDLGAGRGSAVGVHLGRSPRMVLSLLAILKTGAAYLPLDPDYPAERLAFMVEDSGTSLIVTESGLETAFAGGVRCLQVDGLRPAVSGATHRAVAGAEPDDLAYLIYTSGSTGRPKGVMVSHQNVVNFFTGMDAEVGSRAAGVWLAVTSISFDISVLEIFWSLCRGFTVALRSEARGSAAHAGRPSARGALRRTVDFSLFYFASDDAESSTDPYRLLLEGAKFADRHGFAAVWTPERHFHAFGGLFPNPSVASAALAAVTERVEIRAGSVVLPLHHPVRVAEEWAMVDNLSGGRAAISFASGWHANDFVFAPGNYAERKRVMIEGIETVRRLWRGEAVRLEGGAGNEVEVRIRPRPVRPELPVWLTAAGNPETFRTAGEIGAHVLTHLLGQDLDDLVQKVAVYREAWRQAGHQGAGKVTLMLHTFVGDDLETVRERVRVPFTNYLRSSFGLLKDLAKGLGYNLQDGSLSERDTEDLLAHAFNRYFETSALFGTPDVCLRMVERLSLAGIDEIGCLIDFGVETDEVLEGLEHLDALRRLCTETLAPQDGGARDEGIAAEVLNQRVSHLQGTPSLARMLLGEPEAGAALGALERLLLGGEAFPPTLADELAHRVGGELHNMYGPTETTVWSATQEVGGERPVPLGRPIANTSIHLLDRRFQPVPAGIVAEVAIGGDGVVPGYWRRADLTAERFVPDPFCRRRGARLYRTGDLARRLPDGRLLFVGRADHQVKLRGYRIELGEIEAHLGRHPAVREAVVVVREDTPGDARLVAYAIPAGEREEGPAGPPSLLDGTGFPAAEVRAVLREKLPEYMVPAVFVLLDRWPLTPNGKVDRRALPAPPEAGPGEGASFVAPRNPVEEVLATLCAGLLGRERIGVHDDFFELGGHSLLATQLFSRLREAFQVELPLRVIFETATVAGLAERIERQRHSAGGAAGAPSLVRVARDEAHPLSYAQQRLWFLDQLEPGSSAYNDRAALKLKGELSLAVLERSLGEIVRRHETLRTRFELGERGRPVQVIDAPRPVRLPVADLSALGAREQEATVRRLTDREIRRPFNLSRGSLLRVLLLRLAEDEHVVLLTVHHIVWDGWSNGIFLSELAQLYDAFSRGRPSPLPELAVQYVDVAHWQRQWLEGEVMESLLAYWKRQLGGSLPLMQLPTDRPRESVQTLAGRRVPFRFSAELSGALRQLGKREGATLFMTLLAGLNVVLHSYRGETDVVIGTDVANRNRVETERLIGFFVNQLVLRTDLGGDPDFRALLDRVRGVCLAAYAHQDLPFNKLVDALGGERDLSRTPLFQVKLVLQNAPMPQHRVEGLTLSPVGIEWESAKFDVLLNFNDSGETIEGDCEYNTDLFEPATITVFLDRFERVLGWVAADPAATLGGLRQRLAAEEQSAKSSNEEQRTREKLSKLRRAQRKEITVPAPPAERPRQ